MNNPHRGLAIAVLALSSLASTTFAADRPENGTRIVGSDEAPAVLNIVPWQKRELGGADDPNALPAGSVLDDALKPVDRTELQREIDYSNVLHQNKHHQE